MGSSPAGRSADLGRAARARRGRRSACWRSRCELIGQTSRRRCSGSRWWSSRACRSPGVGGLRSSSRRSCPRSRPRRCSATGPSSSRCCGSRCTPPPRYTERDRLVRVLLPVAVLTSVAISVGERWDRGLNWVEILTDLVVTFGVPFLLGRMTFNRRRRIVRERGRDPRGRRRRTRGDRPRAARRRRAPHERDGRAGRRRAGGRRIGPGRDGRGAPPNRGVGRTGLAEMRRLLEVLKAEATATGGRRSRASPASTSSSTRCGPRACRSKRSSKERRDRCRPASTCPPTASSRKRSPTRSGMPAGERPGRRAL